MQLPDFSDFLNTLDSDTISSIMKDANIAAKLVTENTYVLESNKLGLQMLSISYQMSLTLLAVYHKWLEQSL